MSEENPDSDVEMDVEEAAETSKEIVTDENMAEPDSSQYPASKSCAKQLFSIETGTLKRQCLEVLGKRRCVSETENPKRKCVDDIRSIICSEIAVASGSAACAPSVALSTSPKSENIMFEKLKRFIQNHPNMIANLAMAKYGNVYKEDIEKYTKEIVKCLISDGGEGETDEAEMNSTMEGSVALGDPPGVSSDAEMIGSDNLIQSMSSVNVGQEDENSPPFGFTASEWTTLLERAVDGVIKRIIDGDLFKDFF